MSEIPSRRKVLLLGWDAADWNLIHPLLDQGLLPNLQQLINGGVIGNLATLQPCLSPLLWTSIATGKTADKHGITGFVEPLPDASGVRIASSTSRQTKALWNVLSQNNLQSIVINWYASHPAEPIAGTCISNRFAENMPPHPSQPWPIPSGCIHPEAQSPDLSALRLHPAELQPAELKPLIPRIAEINHDHDRRPWKLACAMAHCASVHAMATHCLENLPWDFAAIYYDTLDTVGHEFMPYHPPRLEHVASRDFELYSEVITGLYIFHDQMLGRLRELAGPETTILLVSDHGFHSGKSRPHPSTDDAAQSAPAWHRPYGVFAASGPGILHDERVYGAGLLDIAPTILMLFDLPTGHDMDGQPLTRILKQPPEAPHSIPSWDEIPGNHGMHPPDALEDPVASATAVKQLIDLGYLPPATAENGNAVAIAIAESQFNLAAVHLHHARPHLALNLLDNLLAAHPAQPRFLITKARALADLGRHRDCRETVAQSESIAGPCLQGDLLVVASLLAQGEIEAARQHIQNAGARNDDSPSWHLMIGRLFAERRMWEPARAAFTSGLELDEDDPHLHCGMARIALENHEYNTAAEHALAAVALLHAYPEAHHILGIAMAGLGEIKPAIQALRLAVTYAPEFPDAHLHLALALESTGDLENARTHREKARGVRHSP